MICNDNLPAMISAPLGRFCNAMGLDGYEQSTSEYLEIARELRDLSYIAGHGEMEKHVTRRILALARQMMQDTFDQLSREEGRRTDVLGPQGEVLRHVRSRCRTLETVFGPVQLTRLGYSNSDTASVFPLDVHLNMPERLYSEGMQMLAAEMAAQGSYDIAVAQVTRMTEGRFPKRQMEQMVRNCARDFYDFYAAAQFSQASDKESDKNLLIVSVDGKGIVMRHEDLREDTRRRAEASNHKLEKRLTRGEKRNRKRMAIVAVVYEVAAYFRRAEDIIRAAHRSKDAPTPVNKRVWASVAKEPAEVLDDVMEEVKRRDPLGKRTLVVLADGQEEQLRQVTAALKRHKRKATIFQDFFHVSEYVWSASLCFYKEDDPARQVWVDERLVEILKGNASVVAAGMGRSATLRNLSTSEREAVDHCRRYLINSSKRLDYDRALRMGAPIGTGVVEGACRHLVRARMEISGARWSLEGAEAVLKVRALMMSGDWDAYCSYHWRQESLRNYPEACVNHLQAA